MQSEPNAQNVDPSDVAIAPEAEPPGRIYKQVVREVLARIDQRLADIEKQAAAPQPSAFASDVGLRQRSSLGRLVKRGAIALVLFAGVAGAALAWQRADQDTLKLSRWTPRFLANALFTKDNPDVAQQTDSATPAATDATASPVQQAAAEGEMRSTATDSPDLPQLVQKMAHDIEGLQQGIEQLKVSQDQMSRDSAKAVEQFKASEDELIRMLLRVSEQNAPKTTGQAVPARARTSQATSGQTRTSGAQQPRATTATRPRPVPSFFSRRPS